MTKMRRALLVEYYFYPEGWAGAEFPRELAVRLCKEGYEVTALCGSEMYVIQGAAEVPDPRARGVRLLKVPRLPLELGARVKLLGHLWFCISGFALLLVRARPEAYITQTNPPLFLLIVALIARLQRRPLIIVSQDLYPEVLLAHDGGRLMRAVVVPLRFFFDAAYRSAQRVVSLGQRMSQRLLAKGVRLGAIVEIQNWSAGEPESRVSTPVMSGRDRVIVYTGNLGAGHEFETLLRGYASSSLRAEGYRLVFVGRVAHAVELLAMAEQLGVRGHVEVRPHLPIEEFDRLLSRVALAVCTMRTGFEGVVVPSKLIGYLARGAPVLYIGPPGDITDLLCAARAGECLANGDVEGVATFLGKLRDDPAAFVQMGNCGLAYYWAHLSRERALAKYSELVSSVVSARVGA